MKSEDRTETVDDSKEAREETATLRYCLTIAKEQLTFLNEVVADEFKMSRNTLVTIKIGLFSQYIGIALLLYIILTNSWTVNGRIQCMDSEERELNSTENLIIASLCRNPIYRDRFSGTFIVLESMTMILLLVKLAIATKKVDQDFQDYWNIKLDEKIVFVIVMIPRSLLYLVIPFQSLMATNFSFKFGSLLSLVRLPFMLLFSLIGKLLTLPIAIFFPFPLRDTVEADFTRFFGEKASTEGMPLSAKITVNCFESCHLSFEWGWYLSVLFLFLNFTIVYWFVGFTGTSGDAGVEGRALDSRENCVEFIRVSEVSEDFSFEEGEEESRIEEEDKHLKKFGKEEESRKVDEDVNGIGVGAPYDLVKNPQIAADCRPNEKELTETPKTDEEALKEQGVVENCPSSESKGAEKAKKEKEYGSASYDLIKGPKIAVECRPNEKDLTETPKTNEEASQEEIVIENGLPVESKGGEGAKKTNEVIKLKSIFEDLIVSNKTEEPLKKDTSLTNKGTQTFSLKLHKGCQTFVPIRLHKKVNKKTQVSPICVDVQTNTDAVTTANANTAQKKDVSHGDSAKFMLSKSEQDEENCSFRNNKNENVKERIEAGKSNVNKGNNESTGNGENGESGVSEKDNQHALEKSEHDNEIGKFSPDSNVLVEANEQNAGEKFGFPELKIIPVTLDFERRIIRENQISRINVEAFLKCLEKEDDRDVVFVEKDLLLDTFRSIILTTKASTVEDAVCPRTGDSVDECRCRVHGLVKKFTKQKQQNDEVDGLKMETEDDDYSDDESFFNGFRL